MPTSEKRIAANRANALKSTGPKSEQGKRRSARNGARHAMLATVLLLDHESRERLAEVINSFHADFKPTNHAQELLVDKMAISHWRVFRHVAIESASIIHEKRRQHNSAAGDGAVDPATRTMLAIRSLADKERHADLMSRYEQRYDRQFYRALEALLKLQQLDREARRTPASVARENHNQNDQNAKTKKSRREPNQPPVIATPDSAREPNKEAAKPTQAAAEPTQASAEPITSPAEPTTR